MTQPIVLAWPRPAMHYTETSVILQLVQLKANSRPCQVKFFASHSASRHLLLYFGKNPVEN